LRSVAEYETWLGVGNKVDASYGGSISTKITLPTSSYIFFLNDSNEHGYYFFKCYYSNL
jgi:hypothetical protein